MILPIPAPLHRRLLRLAHAARIAVWRWRGAEVRGCNVIARDPQGRILLVRHTYQYADLWMLPGGGLERGENPERTAARELREETGCQLADPCWFATDRAEMDGWVNNLELVAGMTADHPIADGREIAAARFFAPDSLPAETSAGTLRRIALWQKWAAEHA